jgi:hypothetical protein
MAELVVMIGTPPTTDEAHDVDPEQMGMRLACADEAAVTVKTSPAMNCRRGRHGDVEQV